MAHGKYLFNKRSLQARGGEGVEEPRVLTAAWGSLVLLVAAGRGVVNSGGVVQDSRTGQWGVEGRGPDLHGRDLARVGGARPLWEPPGRRCSGQQPPPAQPPLPPALAAPRVPTSGRLRLPSPPPFLRPPAPGRVWGARPSAPGSKEGGPVPPSGAASPRPP